MGLLANHDSFKWVCINLLFPYFSLKVLVAKPKCNTHFFRLVLKALKQLSYPWSSFQSLDTTKMSSRFTPDSLIACPTSHSFLQHFKKILSFFRSLKEFTLSPHTDIPLYLADRIALASMLHMSATLFCSRKKNFTLHYMWHVEVWWRHGQGGS